MKFIIIPCVILGVNCNLLHTDIYRYIPIAGLSECNWPESKNQCNFFVTCPFGLSFGYVPKSVGVGLCGEYCGPTRVLGHYGDQV